MKKIILTLIIITTTNIVSYSQSTLKDSVNVLYKNYFELLRVQRKVDNLDGLISNIELRHENFNELIKSNNESISTITNKELFSQKVQVSNRRNKIINTSGFVSTANVSLNAIKLLDAVTNYLNDIAELNSPENEELGFSLSTEIENILESKIIKGNNKINKGKSSKFIEIVDNIIKSPISDAISSAVPVVGSIRSVINLVMGTAIRGEDISVNDVIEFKAALKDYIEHYEGLAKAQSDFNQNLNSVNVRKEALQLLLYKYTTERIVTLTPNTTLPTDKNKLTLTQLINREYQKDNIQQKVDIIINDIEDNYSELLNNPKLKYPYYAVNQAKFIRDEIESLGKEYIAIYESYQNSITEVLNKSKNIGDPDKIDEKIKELDTKLSTVEIDFEDALNIENLNTKFKLLVEY